VETGLVVGFALAGSVGAICLAAAFLVVPARVRTPALPALVAFAAGSLIAAAFLSLLPEAAAHAPLGAVLTTTMVGIFAFFLLEKLLLWRHYHDLVTHRHHTDEPGHGHVGGTVGPLLLVGDAVHNFGDGIVIAVTFGVSVELGVAVSLAIIVHEVAQEVGDFAILLDAGYRPAKAFVWNTISGLSTLLGAGLAMALAEEAGSWAPYVMALATSTFLYIGMADLMPTLHRHVGTGATAVQMLWMVLGVSTIWLVRSLG
jgi:zinc and cadmium transporter